MSGVRGNSRALSALIGATTLALAGGLLTATPSWAADPSINLATADLTAAAAASGGAFSVSGSTATDDVTVTGNVVLTGAAAAGRVVTVSGGTTGTPRLITLQGVSATADDSTAAAIQLASGAHAVFTLNGTSTLTGTSSRPGLGIPVGAEATLTAAALSGRLDVTGTGTAAAIGGDGNAVLNDPTAPVTDASFTGIAGSRCGALTVTGGTVNASASGSGAAIGGGRFGAGCAVKISAGLVTAAGVDGAGIGGGTGQDGISGYGKDSPGGAGGAVTISGGAVTASSTGSAPIGGGRGGGGSAETLGTDGAKGSLTITGGSVKLTPRASNTAADPSNGGSLGQVKIPSAAGVSQVLVTPAGGSAMSFNVAVNHPSDSALYLFLPYPKTYTIAVTTGATTTRYQATLAQTGSDVIASVVTPATLAAAAVTIPSATWGYAPAAAPVQVTNTGGTAATITAATMNPTGQLTVNKPATVSVPANGSNSSITVSPVAGLAVGTYQATLTLAYNGTSVAVPISFAVTGSPELHLSAPVFPSMTAGTAAPAAQDLVITNAGSAPATLTGVSSSDLAFSVESSTATLAPGASVSVKVQPAAGLGVGTHQATITANYGTASVATTVSLAVDAAVVPPAPVAVTVVKSGQSVVTLVKGSSITIPAFGYLADGSTVPLTWTSSSAAVASVSASGSIKALNAGSSIITASAGNKVATIKLTVLAKKTKTKVKSVSASVPKKLKVGARVYVTAKFSPTTAPGAKVTYSSSSKAVVTVDAAGTMIAKKKGKSTIAIKAGGKTKKYKVTIS